MLNKKLLLLLGLVCCLALAGSVRAQSENYYTNNTGIQNLNPTGSSWLFPTYNTTIVTLTYATSGNYSEPVDSSDTNHHETMSPTVMTATEEGIGIYNIHYQVLYYDLVTQTIVLTIQSGNSQIINIPLTIVNSGFTLDITIVTSNQPQFPSPAEMWNYGNAQQLATITGIYNAFARQEMIVFIIIGVMIFAGVIGGILLALLWRHNMREKVRMTRVETYGYGGYRQNRGDE